MGVSKEMTEEELKTNASYKAIEMSCKKCNKLMCDFPSPFCKWYNSCFELAKECEELKAQIEKMKCCGNCINHNDLGFCKKDRHEVNANECCEEWEWEKDE